MKTLTTTLLSIVFLVASSQTAFAQDDDDLFGDDTSGDGSGDGTTDSSDGADNTGNDGTSDGGDGMAAKAPMAGGVAKGSGTLGVGFATTTTNTSGVEAQYWLSETLVAVGLARLLFLSGDNDTSVTSLQFGGGAMLVLKDHGQAALMVGGRFLLGYGSVSVGGMDSSATSIAIEAPLRLQVAMHKNVSVHIEGGAAILIGDQAGLGGDPLTNFGFGIGTNNLFGSAGLTFYFD